MGREPCRWSSIGPRRGATSRARAGCKFVLSTLLATIALFAASTVSSHAQSEWTGQFTSNWFLSGNWIGGIPTQTRDADINTVSPNATVIASPGAQANNLTVGANQTGMLTIQAGGTLVDQHGTIGNLPGGVGTVIVTGPGSSWTNVNDVVVGGLGTGTLIIQGGATAQDGTTASSTGGSVGLSAGSTGTVIVTGPGSSWINGPQGGLNIGSFGTGTLMIADGGRVIDITPLVTNIGQGAGSVGTATVTGAGSLWSDIAGIRIGNSGTGTLTIAEGGIVATPNVVIANNAGSIGTLNIGAAAGNPAAAPGTLTATSVAFGAGTGTINFNHTSTDYVFAPAISGNGTVNVLAGTTTLTAANSYSGPTNIIAGTLQAGASNTFSPNSNFDDREQRNARSQWLQPDRTQRHQCRLGEHGHGHCAGHGLDDDQLRGSWRNDRDEHLFGGRRFAIGQACHQRRHGNRHDGPYDPQQRRSRRRNRQQWHSSGECDQWRDNRARRFHAYWRGASGRLRLRFVPRRRCRQQPQ